MGERRAGAVAVLATIGLLLASCADEPDQVRPVAPEATATTAPAPWGMASPAPVTTPTTAPAAAPGTSILPDVTVDDVAGGTARLASLVPAPQPLLVWFWAPT